MSDYSFCLLAFNHQLVSCLTDFRVLVTVSYTHFLISVAIFSCSLSCFFFFVGQYYTSREKAPKWS